MGRPAPDRATEYARRVVAGDIVAGPPVRNQCARHLRDLNDGWRRGVFYDEEAAAATYRFFETLLRLNGGQFEGKPFLLLPWQAFIVGALFGWKRRDGTRRHRLAYLETAKGSGKSPLCAGIALKALTADREARAECYAAASKRDQAMVLFRDAVAMVKQSPALRRKLVMSGGDGNEWNIAFPATGGFFRPISSEDGQSGPRPHCGVLDELHEHKDDGVVEMMQAGAKFRRQPLNVLSTNSPSSRTSVCARYRELAIKIAAGVLEDDEFFPFVCTLDDEDDPLKDEACWIKANPSIGTTFDAEWLRARVRGAIQMPSREGLIRRLHFCQPTDAAAHWIGQDLWDAAQTAFDIEQMRGFPCWLGLDLSNKRDLTALAAAWRLPDGSLRVATWFWTPEETLEARAAEDRVEYGTWAKVGHIFPVPGRIIDKNAVARFVKKLHDEHDVRGLAYDQAGADDFLAACDNVGLDAWIWQGPDEKKPVGAGMMMIRHGQGFAGYKSPDVLWMNRSITALEDGIVKATIQFRENPVLTWNSASAVLQQDEAGNRKWDKRKATGRIDGMVAVSEAVGAAEANISPGPARSIYGDPERFRAAFGEDRREPAPQPRADERSTPWDPAILNDVRHPDHAQHRAAFEQWQDERDAYGEED